MPEPLKEPTAQAEETPKEPDKEPESKPAEDPAEQAARAKGWKPEAEYTGDPGTWVSAKEFMAREPLYKTIKGQNKAIKELKTTVEGMAKHFERNVNSAVERRVSELKNQKREAIKEGDVEKVEAIDAQIEGENKNRVDAPKQKDIDPAIETWVEENPWYLKDRDLHDFALAYNESYLKRNPGDVEGSLAATAKATRKAFPEKFTEKTDTKPNTPPSPVEGQASPPQRGKGYTTSRLNDEQKLVLSQYIKAGTFDRLAKEAKMSPTEYYIRNLEETGALS